MPFADRKTWDNARPSACKETGLGKACDGWKAACLPVASIADNKAKSDAALKAVNAMHAALKLAKTKLAELKDSDAKKKPALDLVKLWETETTKYQNALSAGVFKAVGDDLKEKHDAAVQKAKNAYLLMFTETERQMNEVMPTLIGKVRENLNANKLPEAETALQNAKGKLKNFHSAVYKPEVALAHCATDAGVKASDVPLALVIDRIKPAQARLKALYAEIEKVEKEFGELEQEVEAPQSPNNNPEYKRAFDLVTAAYKETLAEVDVALKKANALYAKGTQVKGNPLVKSNPDGIVRVIEKLVADMEAVAKESSDALYSIRESSGKARTLLDTRLPPGDVKLFAPLMTRGMTLNGKIVSMSNRLEGELRDVLEEIIEGGNPTAVPLAKAVLAKL